jgi:hypothetical protein
MFPFVRSGIPLRLLSRITSAPDGEICVWDLTGDFDVSGPTISHHLKVLREEGAHRRRAPWDLDLLPASRRQPPPTRRAAGHLCPRQRITRAAARGPPSFHASVRGSAPIERETTVPGASEQTRQVKVLNANWAAGADGDDGRFELMIVTEDGQQHTISPGPTSVTALPALRSTPQARARHR